MSRSMPAQKPFASQQDYGTPKDFLKAVTERFGPITFDLAAHKGNKVCDHYFAPAELTATYIHDKSTHDGIVLPLMAAGANGAEASEAFYKAIEICQDQDLKKYKIKVKNYDTEHKGFDSLSQNWNTINPGGIWWLNPEYEDIAPWAEKCHLTSRYNTAIIPLLIPASVGSNYFREFIHEKASVKFLSPRLSFDGIAPYPKDLLLAIYGLPPGYECWRWKD